MSFLTIDLKLSTPWQSINLLIGQWADIFRLGCECFLDMDYDANGLPILPSLSDIINSYSKAKAGQPIFEPIQPLDFDNIHGKDSLMPPPPRDFFHDGQVVLPLDTPTVT